MSVCAAELAGGHLAAFEAALSTALQGDLAGSLEQLGSFRDAELRAWFVEHAQNVGRFRAAAFQVSTPAPAERLERDPVASYRRFEADVVARDAYHCRYCGQPVIHESGMITCRQLVGLEYFRTRGGGDAGRHGVRLVLSAALDHVVPHSRGGGSHPNNLLTCCWPCNHGKAGYTLSELGLDDPRNRDPVVSDWIGLRRSRPFGRVAVIAPGATGAER